MVVRSLMLVLPIVAIVSAACGGSGASPQTPEKPAAEAAAPGEKPEGESSGGKSLVEHRREFMESCTAKVASAPDYCECAWEQMTKTFTEEEMNAEADDQQGKLAQLRDRVEAVCKSKLPEDAIKSSFIKACESDVPALTPYCDCKWTQLRKKISPAEMSDETVVKSDRFTSAKKDAVKVCGAKMPEDVVRQAFLKGCAKDPKLEPFCGCAWKQLRTEKSAAEIEEGLFDMEAIRPKFDKACSKLRPQ